LASADSRIGRFGEDDSAVADVERFDFSLGAGSRSRSGARREAACEHVVEAANKRDDGDRDDCHDSDEQPRTDTEPAPHRIE